MYNDERNMFNAKVRAFALANKKPLFDIAALESSRDDGSTCTAGADQQWLCSEYTADQCHPDTPAGRQRLAKAMILMLADLLKKGS